MSDFSPLWFHVWYAHTRRNGTKKSQDFSSAYFQRVFSSIMRNLMGASLSFSSLLSEAKGHALLCSLSHSIIRKQSLCCSGFSNMKGSHHFHDKGIISTLSNLFSRRVRRMTKDRSKIEMSREQKKRLLECRWKRLFKSQEKSAWKPLNFDTNTYLIENYFEFKTTLEVCLKRTNLRGPAIQIALKLKMSTAYCEKAAFHDFFFHYRITFGD